MQIIIENLDKLVSEADTIFLKPEAEEVLVQLLEVQQKIEQAIDAAKLKLEEAAKKANPNFSSIQADRVKVYYRVYGSKYKIDESLLQFIPKELYTVKTSFSANTDAIEKYAEQKKGFPQGIIEPERPKSITFSFKRGEK